MAERCHFIIIKRAIARYLHAHSLCILSNADSVPFVLFTRNFPFDFGIFWSDSSFSLSLTWCDFMFQARADIYAICSTSHCFMPGSFVHFISFLLLLLSGFHSLLCIDFWSKLLQFRRAAWKQLSDALVTVQCTSETSNARNFTRKHENWITLKLSFRA